VRDKSLTNPGSSLSAQNSNARDPAGHRWELAAYLVRERALGSAMAGGGIVVAVLAGIGWDVWPCPFRQLTGLPCPGCGMTRACLAMLRGNWAAVWKFNPFGPVFALFWVVVVVGLLLPEPWRGRLVAILGRFERRTRWAAWVGAGLLIYSLTRWCWSG